MHGLASQQHGLITRGQARGLGLTEAAIRYRIRAGRGSRVRTGVFVLRGVPPSWEQTALAAVLAGGERSWASHGTAATLWGLRGFDEDRLEITVPLERRPRVEGVRVHRSGTIQEVELRTTSGVPVLSPARTIVDLSSRLDVAGLGRLVDEGLRRGVLSLSALDRVVRRLPGIAPGRSPKKIAQVLADRVPGYGPSGSDLEQWVFDILVGAGLPAPVRQHKVVVGSMTYYIDLAYPTKLVAIEVDGFEFHRERTTFDADRARQNDLVRAGWTILRFTSRSTTEEMVTSVRDLLFGRFASS